MQLVTYKGGCATICEFGQKFTQMRKSIVLNDAEAKPFMNNINYNVTPIKEEVIVPSKDDDEKRKKLMKLSLEKLKEMCEMQELSTEGKKEELVDRLLAPKE
jgi:hypothetical protein